MAQPHFRSTHDVQSFAKLYQEKERKQKEREQQKHQHQREQQQKQQQKSTNLSTALTTPLEQDVGALILTETQSSSYTSGGLANIFADIDDLGLNFFEVFETAELYDGNTLGDLEHTTVPFAPISEIDGVTAEITKTISPDEIKSSESWSPCAPMLAQSSTEPSCQKVANPSAQSQLPPAPCLVRRPTGQLRPSSCRTSDMNTDMTQDEEKSESGDTRESCDDDDSANNYSGTSDDDDTDGENSPWDLVAPGPKFTDRDLSRITAPHILSTSNSAASESAGSTSCVTSPITSFSIDTPAAPLDMAQEPQTDTFALPTPGSDHASVSQRGGNAITSRTKRGHEAIEECCESHDRHLHKRKRSEDAGSGSTSSVLSARTLRILPSRVSEDKPGKRGLTTQCGRQLRRSSRSQPRSHVAGHMRCDDEQPRPNGLPALDVNNVSRRGKLTGRQRDRSPTAPKVASPPPDHSSTKPGPQKSGRVPFLPVATTTNTSSGTCHACGFSAKHLLRMSNTVQTLTRSSAELSSSEVGMDMLELLLGFIRDYATKRLPHNATSTANSDPCDVMDQEHISKATAEMSHFETFTNDESSDDNSGDDSDGDGESVSSDRSNSPDVPEERSRRPQRRRWTSLEESRLHAWVQEEKEWSWIAGKLQRSEQAIVQHWAIMGKQDKKSGKG